VCARGRVRMCTSAIRLVMLVAMVDNDTNRTQL
jgi:hypothetical protein